MTHYTFDDWQARARSLTLRGQAYIDGAYTCLLYTSPSPRD